MNFSLLDKLFSFDESDLIYIILIKLGNEFFSSLIIVLANPMKHITLEFS
jgi:hypothetical protein